MTTAIANAWFGFCLCHEAAEDITIYIAVTMRILGMIANAIANAVTAVAATVAYHAGRLLLWPFTVVGQILRGGDDTRLTETINATIAIACGLFLQLTAPPHSTLHLVLERMFRHETWTVLFIGIGMAQGCTAVYGNYLQRAYCAGVSVLLWFVVIEAVSLRYRGVSGYHAFLIPLLIGGIIITFVLVERHGSTANHKEL